MATMARKQEGRLPTLSHGGTGGRGGEPEREYLSLGLPRLVHLAPASQTPPGRRQPVLKVKQTDAQLEKEGQPSSATGAHVQLPQGDQDSVPFHPRMFKSSTIIKKLAVPRRHDNSWGPDPSRPPQHTRGFILHSERYQWDESLRSCDSPITSPEPAQNILCSKYLSQRDRLATEMEFLERMRGLKRRGQVMSHREPQHLLLGGTPVVMSERMDIMGEISRLRSMTHQLPTKAKDLYVGRGFKLPHDHKLNKGVPAGKVKTTIQEDTAAAEIHDPRNVRRLTIIRAKTMVRNRTPLAPLAPLTADGEFFRARTTIGQTRRKETTPSVELPTAEAAKREMIPNGKGSTSQIPENIESMEGTDQRADSASAHWPESASRVRPPSPSEQHESPRLSPPSRPHTRGSSSTPAKTPSLNLSKGDFFGSLVEESELTKLRDALSKLTTEPDRNLPFSQLQTQITQDLSNSQQNFIMKVYELSSAQSVLSQDDYVAFSLLSQIISKLEGDASAAFDNLDISKFTDTLMKYMELFSSVDRAQAGRVSFDSLRQIICSGMETDVKSPHIAAMLANMKTDVAAGMDRLTFVAYLPYFLNAGKD